MPIPEINLDDKTFDELMKENMAKISIYSPPWTNRNISDPGITFLELFAWLTEMQIYSLNRIPKKNYIAFLKILGIKPMPATPTKTNVTFVNNGLPILVKQHSILKLDIAENDIFFETDKDITAVPIFIDKIVQYSNFKFTLFDASTISPTKTDLASTAGAAGAASLSSFTNNHISPYFFAFGDYPNVGNSFYMGLNFDDSILNNNVEEIEGNNAGDPHTALPTVSLYIHLYEADLPAIGSHGKEEEEEFIKCSQRSQKIQWEYLATEDDGLKTWKTLDAVADQFTDYTKELTKNGTISFKIPFKLRDRQSIENFEELDQKSEGNIDDNKDSFKLYWVRCKIISNIYEIPPRISHIHPNTVSATFGRSVEEYLANKENYYLNEITIDESNGLPNQIFEIKKEHLPIISINTLEVIYEDVSELWQEIDDDFNSSGPHDNHYICDKSNGTVTFGDGIKGKIPKRASKIRIIFRFGNTKDVFIKENSSFQVYDSKKNNLVFGITAVNLLASSVGIAEETIEDAKQRFRKNTKIPFKAVSSSDFEYIAKSTPGLRVARSKAFPCYENRVNYVLVIVLPYSLSKNPTPNNEFLHTVCSHLNKHRLITTRLDVIGPNYIGIRIAASITINQDSNSQRVLDTLSEKLKNFLSPIPINKDNSGWGFGNPVYRSEIYYIIDSIIGVECVTELSLNATGKYGTFSYDENNNVKISSTSLTYLENFSASIITENNECKKGNNCNDNGLDKTEKIKEVH